MTDLPPHDETNRTEEFRYEGLEDSSTADADPADADADTDAEDGSAPRRRIALGALATLIVLGLMAAVLMGAGGGDGPGASREPEASGLHPVPEGSTLIATLDRDVESYASPDGDRIGTVAATWHGRPSALPVIDQEPGWLRVRLAPRPNGSTAWVRDDGIQLTSTPYRIEINVATMRLKLLKEGEEVFDAPAGIGKDEAPTPVGNFFVTFFQEAPTPDYGPFVMVMSSHSETIEDWQGSGDAIGAIHGPLGSDEAIGDTGAKVSEGCIRLHVDDLEKLRGVPAGTPVDVIAEQSA